ncbi:5-formyltetrahydrofolate cyclo-ligase [Microbaculum marinum]|uniref:5-formyltetrahydrofolate cyclo-ligase n=1 Tax=Microbaculum marinum TaxID=1764581 RepID=A0AAW9RYQ5_9HYPH
MTDNKAEKAWLRRRGRATRRRLSAQARRAAARKVAAWAPDIARLAGRGTVSCFFSFGDELDTAPLIGELVRRGSPLALPVVTGRGQPLTFRRWQPGDPMGRGAFGIREPLETAPVAEPRVVLVPLLLYDRRGYRIGYGGGYYDRTLAAARADRKIAAIGLAFSAQEIGRVPTDRYDQPVDWVLTERGLMECAGGARAAHLPW